MGKKSSAVKSMAFGLVAFAVEKGKQGLCYMVLVSGGGEHFYLSNRGSVNVGSPTSSAGLSRRNMYTWNEVKY